MAELEHQQNEDQHDGNEQHKQQLMKGFLLGLVLSSKLIRVAQRKASLIHDCLNLFHDITEARSGNARSDCNHLSLIFAEKLALSVDFRKICNGAKRHNGSTFFVQQRELLEEFI